MLEYFIDYWWAYLALIIVIILIGIGISVSLKEKKRDAGTLKDIAETEPTKEKIETAPAESKPATAKIETTSTEKTEIQQPLKIKANKTMPKKKEKVEKIKKTSDNDTDNKENLESETVKPIGQKNQRYIVAYDKENGDWVVKKTTGARASKRCKTKVEAVKVAERLAETQDLSLSVKKRDGKFQKRS